ncbi:MAG: hypothetical protein IPK67_18690 [Planctomycetes bacterium]|nr:hypothetical protein [Planctomycetota bacterium]
MKADIVTIATLLQKGGKRPADAFWWFQLDAEDVDRARVLDFRREDEEGFLAGTLKREAATPFRETKIVSCSAGTLERWEKAAARIQEFLHAVAVERARREYAAEKGEAYAARTIPEPPEADASQLRVLMARMLAEGVEGWSPAPKAVLDAPSCGWKRGQPVESLLESFLPKDPSSYAPKDHSALLQAVDALPAQYAQRLWMAVGWTSNLDVMRFFPTKEEAAESKKTSEPVAAPPRDGEAAGKA